MLLLPDKEYFTLLFAVNLTGCVGYAFFKVLQTQTTIFLSQPLGFIFPYFKNEYSKKIFYLFLLYFSFHLAFVDSFVFKDTESMMPLILFLTFLFPILVV